MQTNKRPPHANLPGSIAGFEDRIFSRINAGLAERTESASNVKSAFLADMSHEIRTPIGAIIGLANILLSTKLDDKQKQCVTVLQNSAEALLAMVNRTLDIAKIESSMIDPENEPFDMAALLDQIVGIMSFKAREKKIDLALHYEAGAAKRFVGDSGHIRQIVMNLVGNAIKFTNAGDVTISFATDGNNISVSVADTGIGIAANKIGIIFNRFVQADSSIGRKYGGAGLGLSISKALAENMGGAITVHSVVGKGSTFVLNLRLLAAGEHGAMEACYEDNAIYLDTAANAVHSSTVDNQI
jgi:signal transduction histidine kinase